MISRKIAGKMAIMILLVVMLSSVVAALGVSPARNTIDFTPNERHTFSFDIINEQNKDMRTLLSVEGDADGSEVFFQKQIIELSADEQRKKVTFDVKMPTTFDTPGTKELRIVITELPDESSNQPIHVGTLVGVVHQIRIKVPYEGKYLKTEELEVANAKPGENIMFRLPVSNLGTENIGKVKAKIKILGPTNEFISEVVTQEVNLEVKKRTVLEAYWKADVNPGKYFAVAEITFDEKNARVEKIFNVGDLGIKILEIITRDYSLGDIAKLDILLKSTWNEKLQGIYGELFIKNRAGDEVAQVKTASIDLNPDEEKSITAFWDTYGLEEGTYFTTLKVYSGDASIERQFELTLALTKLTANLLGATAKATIGEPDSTKSIMMVVVILLIIINISWFIFFRKRIKK